MHCCHSLGEMTTVNMGFLSPRQQWLSSLSVVTIPVMIIITAKRQLQQVAAGLITLIKLSQENKF